VVRDGCRFGALRFLCGFVFHFESGLGWGGRMHSWRGEEARGREESAVRLYSETCLCLARGRARARVGFHCF
jgi:hypothetical protein